MKPKEYIENKIPDLLLNPDYRPVRHLVLQLVLVLITINVFWDSPDSLVWSMDRVWAWLGYYMVLNLLIYTNVCFFAPEYLLKNKYPAYFILSFSLILLALVLIGVLQRYFYQVDTEEIPVPLFMTWIGLLSSVFSISLLLFGISSLLLFRYWILAGRRIDELQNMQLQSELVYLKNQINPHFLFNMLNNANIMVEEEPEVAAGILTKLEEMLRYQLDDSEKNEVNLMDDIAFLKRYLQLEQTRRDHFLYRISLPDDLTGIRIPPLLFITFVENAAKHNWVPSGNTFVDICFFVERNRLIFICKNSCLEQPLNPKRDGGLGLINICRRLELLYGSGHTLEISKSDSEYRVRLEIKGSFLTGFKHS